MTLGASVLKGGCLVPLLGGDTGTSNYQGEGNDCTRLYVLKAVSLAKTALFPLETGMLYPIPVQVGSTLIPKTPRI